MNFSVLIWFYIFRNHFMDDSLINWNIILIWYVKMFRFRNNVQVCMWRVGCMRIFKNLVAVIVFSWKMLKYLQTSESKTDWSRFFMHFILLQRKDGVSHKVVCKTFFSFGCCQLHWERFADQILKCSILTGKQYSILYRKMRWIYQKSTKRVIEDLTFESSLTTMFFFS